MPQARALVLAGDIQNDDELDDAEFCCINPWKASRFLLLLLPFFGSIRSYRPENLTYGTLKKKNKQVKQKYPSLFKSLPTEYDSAFKSPCWWTEKVLNTTTTTKELKCLPYAYIIGVAKCATTDLYLNLCQHNDVLPNDTPNDGAVGELYFWHGRPSSPNCYKHELARAKVPRGDSTLERYTHRYPKLMATLGAGQSSWGRVFTIDSSVQNAGGDFWTPRLLFEVTPQARIILRTRRPANRVNSDWSYSNLKGNPDVEVPRYLEEFQSCLTEEGRKEYECFEAGHFNVVVKGLYILIIEHWLRVFPSSQFLVSPLEAGATSSVKDAAKFLHLSEFTNEIKTLPKANSQSHRKPFNNQTISLMEEFYRPYNERLLHFMKTESSHQSPESISAIESYLS